MNGVLLVNIKGQQCWVCECVRLTLYCLHKYINKMCSVRILSTNILQLGVIINKQSHWEKKGTKDFLSKKYFVPL